MKLSAAQLVAAQQQISQIYVGYFNRAPDAAGLNYWVGRVDAGMSYAAIAQSFSVQTESINSYAYLANPNVASVSTFLTSVYANLFNRAPDAAGLAYWTGEISSGRSNVGNAIINIISGAQDVGTTLDKTTITNKMTAGLNWASAMANINGATYGNSEANSAKAIVASVTSDLATVTAAATATTSFFANGGGVPATSPVALTTGADTLVGGTGNDTFNAPFGAAATFTALDNIDGGAGNDTLNITSVGAFSTPAGINIRNVETVNLTGSAGVTLSTTTASGFSGVNNVNVTAAGALSLTAAAGQAVAVTDATPGGNTVTSVGGSSQSVTVTGATTGDNITVGSTAASPTGVISVSNTSSAAGGATTNTITTVGGSSVVINDVVTSSSAAGANGQATAGAVQVTGSALTTSVSVTESAPTTAVAAQVASANVRNAVTATRGVTDSAVTIADLNAGSTTVANTITSVSLNNVGATTISSTALNSLTLAGTILGAGAAGAVNTTEGGSTATIAANKTLTVNTGTGNAINANAAGVIVDASNQYSTMNFVTSGNFYVANTNSNTSTTVSIADTALRTVNVSGTGLLGFVATPSTTASGFAPSFVPNLANSNGINTAITAINVSGSASLIADLSSMTGLTSLSGANTTGSLQVSINDTITSFTGGAGRNIVEISAADATKVINLGTNSANQLLLTGDGSVYIGTGKLTTTNVTGYTQLGVADVTANTTYTYDVSKFAAGVNTLEVWAYTTGSTNNFTGVANNTNLVIDGAATTSVVLASGLSGTSSAINVTLNGIAPLVGTGTIGYATTALSLADINGFGVGTVNFTTDASVGGGAHTLTTFTDANLANLNISGTGALVVTNAFTTNVIGTLTINDNDTSTAATTFTGGVTGNSLTNINFTGSHAVNLGALTDNLASISISNVNTGTTGVATITGHTDANLSSLTLSGSIALTGTYALNGAASVSGASDNSIVSLTMSGGGNKTITLGNGNDSVTTGAGVDTINLGNGNNTVVSGAGADVITLGTGANTVTPGAGADRVTFGTHASGVVDAVVVLATSETYSAATAATIVSATTALTGIDTFTGMRTGDTFSIAGISNTFTGATATTIAGATGTAVSLVRGSFNTTSNVFTTSSTGADTLLVYDADAAGVATVVEAVALIGYVGSGTVAAGVLTLG